jgi:DNA-binding response OmpR family regulator
MHPGLIEIDFEARQVKGPHGQVHLTAKEFELPFYLAPHPKTAVSHRESLHAV